MANAEQSLIHLTKRYGKWGQFFLVCREVSAWVKCVALVVRDILGICLVFLIRRSEIYVGGGRNGHEWPEIMLSSLTFTFDVVDVSLLFASNKTPFFHLDL